MFQHIFVYTSAKFHLDSFILYEDMRPWSFCKTCVAMKFVDDDDDDDDNKHVWQT